MDSAKYRELVEDITADISQAEQTLSDLRGVERYVSSKAESQDKFNGLLKEIQNDIAETNRTLSELRNLERYVGGKIASGSGPSNPASREGKSGKGSSESDAPPPPVEQEVASTSAEKKGPHKDAAKDVNQSDAMQTVEFGPDGFPME